MIRAKDRTNKNFLYIYSMYYTEDYSRGDMVWHLLCSEKNHSGFRVFILDEVIDVQVINENQMTFPSEYIHPLLEKILNDNWELYNSIVEGNEESWAYFEELLGYRP